MPKTLVVFGLILLIFGIGFVFVKNLGHLPFNFLEATVSRNEETTDITETSGNLTEINGSLIETNGNIPAEIDGNNEDIMTEINGNSVEIKVKGVGEEIKRLKNIVEEIDDISEKIDLISQKVSELMPLKEVAGTSTESEFSEVELKMELEKEIPEVPEKEEKEEIKEEIPKTPEVKIAACPKTIGSLPNRNNVIINEVAWMGNQDSVNNEWIELKNISGEDLSLAGWQVLNGDNKITIFFDEKDKILQNSLYLLERTNDDAVLGIRADKIYSGALKNGEEALYLFDENCQLQDIVEANPSWPAGENDSKRTMERKPDFSWQTSQPTGGTPKAENSSGYISFNNNNSGGGVIITLPTFYPKILISEVHISGLDPEGKVLEKEDFVELYNPNNIDIDLTGWYLQRKTKNSGSFSSYAPQNLLSGKEIQAKSYFLISNASSSFLSDIKTAYSLTEDNTLVIKNPNKEVSDKVGWGEAQDFETATTSNPLPGNSIGRKWSSTTEGYIDTDNNFEDFEVQNPTPNSQNKSPEPENKIPAARFVFSPETPEIGQEIIFDASSSTDEDGEISEYFWDFGGSYCSTTLSTTTFSFATSGEFLIIVLVKDNFGSTSLLATTTITIKELALPILEISEEKLDFLGEEAEIISGKEEIITNSGQGELNWGISLAQNSGEGWVSPNFASGTVLAFSSSTIDFLIDSAGLCPGNYQATATIFAQGFEDKKEVKIGLTIFEKTAKTIVINEISWMGTSATNSNDEWIELYNNTDSFVDLTGWVLSAKDGTPNIVFSTSSIFAKDYFLLERTDDTTISDIGADLIYKGALENSGEELKLIDNYGNLIDLIDFSLGWFVGSDSDYISMERVNSEFAGSIPNNWKSNNGVFRNGLDADGNLINGTPKSKNSATF
ncbi:MAG: lamin tail domain-containing protein [Candidatus Pacebacteria bacterium]|nr:lamin tail domain-containing protein [Candidatus Paceibacterota bacterium]